MFNDPLGKITSRPLLLTFLLLTVCLAISLPSILSDLTGDDFFFETPLHAEHGMFSYYDFVAKTKAASLMPWWTSSRFELDFFRPLSSLSLYLDFKIMGASPLIAHLHAVIWFVLFFFGAASIIRSLLPRKEAMVAVGIFAFGAYHYLPIGWIAARHAVMGGALAVGSIRFLLHWLRTDAKWAAILGHLLYAIGLLTSESALGVAVFIVATLAFSEEPLSRKAQRGAPVLMMTLGYLLFYKLMGYGAVGSRIYVDPFASPTTYLTQAGMKLVYLLGGFVFGAQPMARYVPGMTHLPLLFGTVAALLFSLGLAITWIRSAAAMKRQLRLLGLIALIAALPALSGMVDGRACLISALAFASISGVILCRLFEKTANSKSRWPGVVLGVMLSIGLFGVSPLSRFAQSYALQYEGSKAVKTAIVDSELTCEADAAVLQLNGTMMLPFMTPFIVAKEAGLVFRDWRFLMDPASHLRIEREDAHTLTAFSLDGGPLLSPLALELFADSPIETGAVYHQNGMQIHVVEAVDGSPTRLRFRIPDIGDQRKTCLLYVKNDRLIRTAAPDIGASLFIPNAFDPQQNPNPSEESLSLSRAERSL